MSQSSEFTALLTTLKAISPMISDEQRVGLLRQAVNQYGLRREDAEQILLSSGLIIGEKVNYFEVLGISIESLQTQTEAAIAVQVDAAHEKHYRTSLSAGGRVRSDGKTEEQWRHILNQARDTLKDFRRRNEHIATLHHNENDIALETDVDPIFKAADNLKTTIQEFSPQGVTSDVNTFIDMVLIPTGEFLMGSNDEKANDNEKPTHTVYLDAFYMDKYPVTNEQYKTFLEANPQWRKPQPFKNYISTDYHDGAYLRNWRKTDYPNGEDKHPVTKVGWYAAMAYAQWVGKRLPTEAEWEKAARGGLEGKKYPWGNSIDLSKANYFYNVGGTAPVGHYPANGYDLHDMSGNVWEWCLDTYDADFYAISPPRNPFAGANTVEWVVNNFRSVQSSRVLRGGSWLMDSQGVRVAYRFRGSPADTYSAFGFRCVRPVTP